ICRSEIHMGIVYFRCFALFCRTGEAHAGKNSRKFVVGSVSGAAADVAASDLFSGSTLAHLLDKKCRETHRRNNRIRSERRGQLKQESYGKITVAATTTTKSTAIV